MKKVTALFLAVAMMASLMMGCGSNANTETGNTQAAGADAEAAAGTEADGEGFKIGGIGPVTGGAAVYGQAVKNGAQIAIDEINAAGGVNGKIGRAHV